MQPHAFRQSTPCTTPIGVEILMLPNPVVDSMGASKKGAPSGTPFRYNRV